MEQHIFDNGTVKFPYIVDDGVKYYPITYISEKVLKRKGKIISRHNEHRYKINTYTVSFDFVDGGVHKTKCVCEEGLKEVLISTRIGHLDNLQRRHMNILLKYFNMQVISEDNRYIDYLDEGIIRNYDLYIQDAIIEVSGKYNKWQKCSKCDCYFPLHDNFFKIDLRLPNEFYAYCRNCSTNKNESIKIINNLLMKIYNKYGNNAYKVYRNHDAIGIYKVCIKEHIILPDMIRNKEDYIKIIDYLAKENRLNKFDFTQKQLIDIFMLYDIGNIISMDEIYTILLGKEYYLYPWKYTAKIFKFKKLDYNIANVILKKYIEIFNVDDSNPLTLNYYDICKKARIETILNEDTLYFAVQYNKFVYPGYMFKIRGKNYYKNEYNLLFDLKYLIEKDMKLETLKIPLYLTKNVLQNKARPLYHFIISNKNGSIFKWVNKLYPNKFIEADFEVNPYRNEFDSDTEAFIHEILKEKFDSVIYNQRNTDNTITINGMVPDWFIFTDHGVYIVEYFGMYMPHAYETSSRIKVYIDKMNNKLNKYKEVNGYKFIFLYPEDVVDDFRGCREKLDEIKENPYVSMV